MKDYPHEILLYRRQFILGPRFVDKFPLGRRLSIRHDVCVTVHPELPTCQVTDKSLCITLLGYLLDPGNPNAQDQDILEGLLSKLRASSSLDEFFQHTYGFGGRWILIVDNGFDIWLFTDPMGLRQVFHTSTSAILELWCASQPGVIAEILNLEIDPEALNGYIATDAYKSWRENVWPGDSTPYREITHLLPNHYLDLKTGINARYWPRSNLKKLDLQDAVEKVASRLKGLMESAAARFDLAFAITAGWDTRLILAASKDIRHRIYYFTLAKLSNLSDAVVAPKLLSTLGLEHALISYPRRMDKEFGRIYKTNFTTAHDWWGRMAQAVYKAFPAGRVCVQGDAAEIARVRFRLPRGTAVTADHLAGFTWFAYDLDKVPFVVKHWEKWLQRTQNIHNIHILDLFYWEHYAGNFAATSQSEWDIVYEIFTPYNCRQLLADMLAVDEKYRAHDHPILYETLILKLWPDVLSEPVNPQYHVPFITRFADRIKRGISGVPSLVKRVEHRVRRELTRQLHKS